MTWLDKGGAQYNQATGRLEREDSYLRAVREIVNHITLQPREIGWQVEAWGGGAAYHIDVKPINLRVGRKPRGEA